MSSRISDRNDGLLLFQIMGYFCGDRFRSFGFRCVVLPSVGETGEDLVAPFYCCLRVNVSEDRKHAVMVSDELLVVLLQHFSIDIVDRFLRAETRQPIVPVTK